MNEVYRLRLDHYMDVEGCREKLEDPLVIQMIFDRRYMPLPVCLNRMIDMMKDELLQRAGEQE